MIDVGRGKTCFFSAKFYCIYVTFFDMIDLVLLLKNAQFTDMWKAERLNVYIYMISNI